MTTSYRPEADVTEICRDLIRIDTTNYGDSSGPGERVAAEYVAEKLADVGIESELFEPQKGRTSLVARWGHPDATDRLLVHGHLDVVPAAKQDWKVDPFSGEVMDGYLWGRGAVDMKDFDAAILSVVRARAKAGRPPKRALTLVFTADEEAGSIAGAHPIVDQRPEWLEGCTESIGEVGGFSTTVAGKRIYLIETAEKGIAWLRLRAQGTAGHGSMRNTDNAVTAVSEAVAGHREARVADPADAGDGGPAGRGRQPHRSRQRRSQRRRTHRVLRPGRPDAGRRRPQHGEPDDAVIGLQAQRDPGRGYGQHRRARSCPSYEDEFFATLRESAARQRHLRDAGAPTALSTPFDGPLVEAMKAARCEPQEAGRHRPALPDVRRHRCQGVEPASTSAASGSPRCGYQRTSTSRACSTAIDERVPVGCLGLLGAGLRRLPGPAPDRRPSLAGR